MSSLYRTFNPKWVTYWGDGNGRDQYITFNNGGLNEQRVYHGPQYNGFQGNGMPVYKGVTPKKDATAFDYKPDGSGRDLYIINSFGLKRNYKSTNREHEHSLRNRVETPVTDNKIRNQMRPGIVDIENYNNWPSPQQRLRDQVTAVEQRISVERLSQSPRQSNSPQSNRKIFMQTSMEKEIINSDCNKKQMEGRRFSVPATTQGSKKPLSIFANKDLSNEDVQQPPKKRSVFKIPKMSYNPLKISDSLFNLSRQTDSSQLVSSIMKKNQLAKNASTIDPDAHRKTFNTTHQHTQSEVLQKDAFNYSERINKMRSINVQTALEKSKYIDQKQSENRIVRALSSFNDEPFSHQAKPMTAQNAVRAKLVQNQNKKHKLGHNSALDDYVFDKIIDNNPAQFGQVRASPPLDELKNKRNIH